MRFHTAIILSSMLLSACAQQGSLSSISWGADQHLPKQQNQAHLGVAGPITAVLGDYLVLAGGANFPNGLPWENGQKTYQNQGFIYQIDADRLQLKSEFTLEDPFAYAGCASRDDYMYIVGGEDKNGPRTKALKIHLAENQEVQIESLASLPRALTNGGLVYDSNNLYFVGGEDAKEVSNLVYRLNLNNTDAKWEAAIELPFPLSNAIVAGDGNGKLFIVGGRKKNPLAKSDIYRAVLKVDLTKETVEEIAELPYGLAAGTGIYWQNNLLVLGGDDASTFHRVEEYLAKIQQETDNEAKKRLIVEKNQIQVQHPGFSKRVWKLDLTNLTWSELNNIKGESPVTTTALVHDETIIIPSGEVKAGIRTDQLLMGTIKH
ncbi:hypothetical protein GQF61_10150 [Sphingobacterium sp. DK4209]|uniref:Galactose oxidase n=2 Tax=Sphingobacterium zhuxiongii TaxID=2662364 RepID=A0A5Q0Q651_9SPHI|nr:hypothetical protein [Sphingobacterium sp. DK4209]MVZ66219.1 hypothetical protein [Sphingobacterium sp. DK4209]QGA24943.1 hypothetical protein GFH32_00785 [Sphingobacterium sp. dk4302]